MTKGNVIIKADWTRPVLRARQQLRMYPVAGMVSQFRRRFVYTPGPVYAPFSIELPTTIRFAEYPDDRMSILLRAGAARAIERLATV